VDLVKAKGQNSNTFLEDLERITALRELGISEIISAK